MPDQNSILGTSGKEAIPFEYQVQEQEIARKKALAQAMMMRGQQAQPAPQMFGLHRARTGTSNYINSALQSFLGAKGLGDAGAQQAKMLQDMQASRSGDMSAVQALANGVPGQPVPQAGPPIEGQDSLPDIMQGGQAPDVKAAIARAMQSKWGNVQAVGTDLQKDERNRRDEIAKLIGGADPRAGAQFLQAGDPSAPIAPITTPPVQFGQFPGGGNYAITTDNKGTKPTLVPEPKAMSITNDLRTGAKITDKAAEYFNYGGKGYDKGVEAQKGLQNSVELLNTLDQNPQLGAGAGGFQFLRKWAETLGVPVSETTTPTEVAAMQLGQKTLDRLGGLGAQVSDADRKFMLETQGSLGNDPEAVRRMLLLEAKYLMKMQTGLNKQIGGVNTQLPDGVTLPQNEFSAAFSQRNADDLERLFGGQGFASTVKGKLALDPAGRIKRVAQ